MSRIIIIESNAYEVCEKEYSLLEKKKGEIKEKGWYPSQDVEMMEFIESRISNYKNLGTIDFDFRL